jgi:hypothetical protein
MTGRKHLSPEQHSGQLLPLGRHMVRQLPGNLSPTLPRHFTIFPCGKPIKLVGIILSALLMSVGSGNSTAEFGNALGLHIVRYAT